MPANSMELTNMVRITNDWEGFKEYAERCRLGAFQIKHTEKGLEIRVHAGRLGYVGVFPEGWEEHEVVKKTHDDMLEFVKARDFLQIIDTVSDELFFI
jgi:hypothetical protein